MTERLQTLTLEPIGVIRSPFTDRASAPRQPYASEGARGTIELHAGHKYEHALEDLEGWEYIWVIFWFHLNRGWRPKILPPRSRTRRGVFATRSPHRPNPLGLSVLKLDRVERRTLHVSNVDLIDGTPILDIKPYVPWSDAVSTRAAGWFEPSTSASGVSDPVTAFDVAFDEPARAQLAWLLARHGIEIETALRRALALGPHPHPYRRIRLEPDGTHRIAHKEWRARFRVDGRTLRVFEIFSGYRSSALATDDPTLEAHRQFVAHWEPRRASG